MGVRVQTPIRLSVNLANGRVLQWIFDDSSVLRGGIFANLGSV